MKSTDIPKKMPVPFAANGTREDLLDQSASGDNTASYSNGFPPITMLDESAGGLPPKGQDFNQILYELAATSRWSNSGATYPFDATFAASISGYPAGSVIPTSEYTGSWLNTTDANSTNPEATGAATTGWVPYASRGAKTISGLSSSSVTLTTLQANCERIILTGTLTANINIVIPAWVKSWTITNACTGNYYVVVKTPSGTGPQVVTGINQIVFCDGTNVYNSLGTSALYDVLPISNGGTGGNTAAIARTNLGLGTLATQNIAPIANGGTAATTAAGARSNLGLGSLSTLSTAPIANGGTGATTATDARNNLGLGELATINVATIATGGTSAQTAAQALINLGVTGSMGSNGYMYIGPLLLQWVNNTSTTVGFVGVSWPKTFSSVLNVQNTVVKGSGGELNWSNVNSVTVTGCNAGCDGAGSFVFAIGT